MIGQYHWQVQQTQAAPLLKSLLRQLLVVPSKGYFSDTCSSSSNSGSSSEVMD
jgi:hypothetical protein